jgi:uncharacterized protein YegP (UPF0339 family)
VKRARYVVFQDRSGDWRWRLVAANGRIVADSGEGYVSRSNAVRAAESSALIAFVAKVEVEL